MMFFAISMLIQLRKNHSSTYPFLSLVSCLTFTVLSVVSDRMVGAWLIVTYCICAIIYRERTVALSLVVALASFITLLSVTDDGYSIMSSSIRSVANAGLDAQISGEDGNLNEYTTIRLIFFSISSFLIFCLFLWLLSVMYD